MAWAAPRTWVVGEVVTAAMLNADHRDNLRETGPALAVFAKEGALAAAAGKARYRIPESSGITRIRGVSATVGTAPAGQAIILDVNRGGTTIFTTQANRPQIAAAAFASAEVTNPDVTTLAPGDYLTIDIDQVGSTDAGRDLTVIVRLGRE